MTLVSVVGDFFSSVAPIFYHFFDDITIHIIIADDSKRDSYYAKKFQNGVKDFCIANNKSITRHFVRIDEDSNSAINKACEYILNNSDGEIYVNVSDGLASLNTIMTQKLLPKGVKFISYDMFDNEFHILDISGIIERKKAKSMNIKEHFMLKNCDILSYESVDFVLKNEYLIKKLFTEYHFQFDDFKKDLSKNQIDFNQYTDVVKILKALGFSMDKKSLSYNKKILTGSLFEMYMYLIVRDLEFDDVLMGVVLEDKGIRNEYDLLAIKDNHIYVIECKYKNIQREAEKLLYKYAFLREVLDYDSKAVIVSTEKIENRYLNRGKRYKTSFVSISEDLKEKIKESLL